MRPQYHFNRLYLIIFRYVFVSVWWRPFTKSETCTNPPPQKKKNIHSVVLTVCTFPYTGTNSINSSLIKVKIKGKVIPVISEVWSEESIWQCEGTSPHILILETWWGEVICSRDGRCVLVERTVGTHCTGPGVYISGHCRRSFTLLTEIRHYTILRLLTHTSPPEALTATIQCHNPPLPVYS